MNGVLPPEKQALKRAIASLNRAVGGIEAGATLCRLGKSQLSDAGNINCPDKWLPADAIADLEGVTIGLPGSPHVTRELARQAGFALVPLPSIAASSDWMQVIAGVSKEAGDVVGKIALHAAGGMTAAEIREADLVREFDELVRIALAGRAAALAVLAE